MKLIVSLIVAIICAVPLYAQEDKSDQSVFKGRILNRQGYPVANAEIDIFDVKSYSNIVPEATHAGQVKTDSEGRFSFSRYTEIFPQIEHSIAIVQAEGYAKQWIRYYYTGRMDEVVLSERSSVLAGRVVEENGDPIEGATVAAFFDRRLAVIGIEAFTSTTDAQGQFEIAGLPLSEKAELYVQKEGYSDFCTIPIYNGWEDPQYAVGRKDIVLTLKVGTSSFQKPNLNRITIPTIPYTRPERPKKHNLEISALSGICEDLEGVPIANAKVYLLSDPNNIVKSNENGHFTLTPRLEECKRNVWWKYLKNKERYETNPSWTELRLAAAYGPMYDDTDTDWMGISAYLIAESPDGKMVALNYFSRFKEFQLRKYDALKLKLAQACHLKGKAVDADGQPLPGAVVEVLMSKYGFDDPDCVYTTTETDEKGCFEVSPVAMNQNYSVVMTTAEGVCLVKQFSAGLEQYPYWPVEHFYSKKPDTIDLGVFPMDPKTYRLSGIVTNHLGRPISNALLKLNAPSQGLHDISVQSDPNGMFVYDDLFAGPVDLECHVGNKGYVRTKTVAGDDDIRFIFSEGVPSNQLGQGLVPSSAIELSFIDEETEEPIILPNAQVVVQPKNNSQFTVDLDDEGKARFLVAPGEIAFELKGVSGRYRTLEKKIFAELYQAYTFQYKLAATERQKVIDESGVLVYPEVLSETGNIWNLKTHSGSSSSHKILELFVWDEEIGTPVPDAEVLIYFNEGKGRFLWKTNVNGKVAFAVFDDVLNCILTSVTCEGYEESHPEKKLSTVYSDITKKEIYIKQKPTSINLQALDLQGNPAPNIWFYHEALLYDRLLKKTKWDRVFDHERSPTDENGQKVMKWFNETGPEPQIEHFICTYYLREHKGLIAEIVKARPGSEITLQVKQPVQVQGRIVDEQGVGIPDLSFNFYYVINGYTTSGPSGGTKSDGSYGPVFLAPGFEYEIHQSRDRIGMFGEGASVFIGPEEGIVSLPDCVLPD